MAAIIATLISVVVVTWHTRCEIWGDGMAMTGQDHWHGSWASVRQGGPLDTRDQNVTVTFKKKIQPGCKNIKSAEACSGRRQAAGYPKAGRAPGH